MLATSLSRALAGSLFCVALVQPALAQAPSVTDDTFQTAVIERSAEEPVFVNFYAVWCGPCRPLFPVLDQVAGDYSRRATLVSVDVDTSDGARDKTEEALHAREMPNLRSIPALVVFVDGEPANILVGNAKEQDVRAFFDRYVGGGK